jgi:hypothetical protein
MPVSPSRAAPAAAPAAAPVLSLEQYASFFVELSQAPERRAELLDRYRITEEQRRAVDAYWQERRAADLDVWSAWSKACASYKAWLAQARGGR